MGREMGQDGNLCSSVVGWDGTGSRDGTRTGLMDGVQDPSPFRCVHTLWMPPYLLEASSSWPIGDDAQKPTMGTPMLWLI